MRNVSTPYFDLDGAPLLNVEQGNSGACLKVRDSQDDRISPSVNFYARNEDYERLRRAAEAFNAIMREPIAQAAE